MTFSAKFSCCVLVFASLSTTSLAVQEARNRLNNHPSPYLAMHGDDPVHWQNWEPSVIEAARREGKLLFVSSGYFACHWCHVMQRESYKNPAIAVYLNQHFIAVKVDRELRPALDAYLINFVQRTYGRAGWPLNVFLSPEGYPLTGLTYLPADRFLRLLQRIHTVWQKDSHQLGMLARKAAEELQPKVLPKNQSMPKDFVAQVRRRFLRQVLAYGDEMEGGFGSQNKFPSAPQLASLLRLQAQYPQESVREFLRLTLDLMAQRGLRDQLGGGFFRYTVDPHWDIPHFEKMLYTNALLGALYLQAAAQFQDPRYKEIAFETLDFVLNRMAGKQGGYIASLSAVDRQGVEGGYYLWQEADLKAILTPTEVTLAKTYWSLQGTASLEAGYLPKPILAPKKLAATLGLTLTQFESRHQTVRSKLLAARQQRSLPRDTKQLAGWNGLFLSALAKAAGTSGGEQYQIPAQALRTYLVTQFWNGQRLLRAKTDSGAMGNASLQDYAYVAQGLLAWANVDPQPKQFHLVAALLTQAWRRFYTPTGWRLAEDTLLPAVGNELILHDGPMPSPSSVLIETTLAMSNHLKNSTLQTKARHALAVGQNNLLQQPYSYATQVGALLRLPDEKEEP